MGLVDVSETLPLGRLTGASNLAFIIVVALVVR